MDIKLFDWNNRRTRLARYGKALRLWYIPLQILVVVLVVVGVAMLVVGMAAGWALLGLAAMPAMVAEWYRDELKQVPIVLDSRTIHARAETELLACLPPNPTPRQLALALMEVNGGLFFDVRFGVGGTFLKEVVSDNQEETDKIFDAALRIAEEVDGVVGAGCLILAMIQQLPAKDTLLGHLQLNEEDLLRGVRWYHHLVKLIRGKHTRHHKGGIGRDWSFGWIPTLMHFGVNVSKGGTMAREGVRGDELTQLIASLDGDGGTIALVGRDGVGKSELVYQLASKLIEPDATIPRGLWYQQVFMLDASRILSATAERGKLENLVSVLLGEAYAAKNIILCLDHAEAFFSDGVGSVDLTSILMPIIEAGRLRMIMTIDEQRYLEISKRTPAIATALRRISIQPTNEIDTLKILEDQILFIEHKRRVTFMYQALREAYRLSQRYIYDVSMPGQAIALLNQAAEYADRGLVSAASVNQALEKTVGVKTATANDDSERETLLNLESLIHTRMIGQERAVQVVSDALRRARSGVRNVNRPVGTFLFLGPTGVGKTELAKSLAQVYFGGEQNLIRLDMNEFVSPDDVARLIADGADDPSSLTAQVMKQPFSVVLLDEIEKAHSSVLTTLLQLLDEGILRDVRNREVSFRDTIVIATSNAGADRIQEYVQRGYTLQQFEETFIDELISSHIFHPEFLNRFDEMVVFSPLSKTELLQVIDLILNSINKTLAEQKITVLVTPDAKEYLVQAGYDPRLGARPMRRVVQRAVENTVAKLLLSHQVTPGEVVTITKEQVESILATNARANEIIEQNGR